MEIHLKEKPTKEAVSRYCRKVESFLSGYNIFCTVELYDNPIRSGSCVNGQLIDDMYSWIRKIIVKNKEIGELEVRIFSPGIEENMGLGKIWIDAWRIQRQICTRLGTCPKSGPHKEPENPYWKLWNYYPMQIAKGKNFPNRYICQSCGYEKLKNKNSPAKIIKRPQRIKTINSSPSVQKGVSEINMELSREQIDKMWGETGPYSQASLIIQTRILDDKVSRVFLVVEAEINPLTFELVKKYRKHFKNDIKIQQLLDHSEYRGLPFGYVSCAFEAEYRDESVMEEAQRRLAYTKETIIQIHRFVMDLINNIE